MDYQAIEPPQWLTSPTTTKALYYGSQAGLLGDYLQTKNILKKGGQHEMNPFVKAVGPNWYFGGIAAANHFLVPKLPTEYQNLARG